MKQVLSLLYISPRKMGCSRFEKIIGLWPNILNFKQRFRLSRLIIPFALFIFVVLESCKGCKCPAYSEGRIPEIKIFKSTATNWYFMEEGFQEKYNMNIRLIV
ncbi:MAG: hypothetical protein ACK5M7_15970 [Draconibacterium sp.]